MFRFPQELLIFIFIFVVRKGCNLSLSNLLWPSKPFVMVLCRKVNLLGTIRGFCDLVKSQIQNPTEFRSFC